jgi:S1-C subfamily serine protease
MFLRALAAAAVLLFATVGTNADPVPEPISPIVKIDGGCSGFSIGEGRIITAGHCISKFGGFEIELSDGSKVMGTLAMFSNPRLADDMAVIQVSVDIPALEVECGPSPAVGTRVHVTGYPAYYGLATVWGTVAGTPKEFGGAWRDGLPINISVAPGYSGSPVLTEEGKVVGILVGGMQVNMSLAIASPSYRLCELIGKDWL